MRAQHDYEKWSDQALERREVRLRNLLRIADEEESNTGLSISDEDYQRLERDLSYIQAELGHRNPDWNPNREI